MHCPRLCVSMPTNKKEKNRFLITYRSTSPHIQLQLRISRASEPQLPWQVHKTVHDILLLSKGTHELFPLLWHLSLLASCTSSYGEPRSGDALPLQFVLVSIQPRKNVHLINSAAQHHLKFKLQLKISPASEPQPPRQVQKIVCETPQVPVHAQWTSSPGLQPTPPWHLNFDAPATSW
jgi:hypothetical protein